MNASAFLAPRQGGPARPTPVPRQPRAGQQGPARTPVELGTMPVTTSRRRTPGPQSAPPAVLHATLSGDRLFLWAEEPQVEDRPPTPIPGWGTPHPWHLPAEALAERLASLPPAASDPTAPEPDAPAAPMAPASPAAPAAPLAPAAPAPWQPTRARLSLPTARSRPLPSPAVGGDPTARGNLQPWCLWGQSAPVREATKWLHPFSPTAAGLILAPEWATLWRAAALVRATVARGAVAPHLAEADNRPAAGWRLTLTRDERQQLEDLAQALPAAAAGPPAQRAKALTEFARFYAGALVRAAASRSHALTDLRTVPHHDQTPARHWLASLLAPTAAPLPPKALADTAFTRWAADPAGVDAPPRLVLRLDEPRTAPAPAPAAPAPGTSAPAAPAPTAPASTDRPRPSAPTPPERWPLALLLEYPAEPGILLPPSDLRRDPAALAQLRGALGRVGFAVPAVLEAMYKDLDEVLLTPEQTWNLLTYPAANLETLGARLLVPSWWSDAPRPRARLRLQAPPDPRGLFGADQLVRFDWQVALGEETITAEAFERLVARRSPFVRLQHGWAVLPPGAGEAVVAQWQNDGPRGELPAGAALLRALATEADGEEVMADAHVLAGLRRLAEQPPELPEPQGFIGTLRPYQRRGLAWLATRADLGLGGILADDMGLGKTVQVLAMVAHRHAAGRTHGPTLIVAPTSVVANWAAEAARFTPGFTVVTHQGADRARGSELVAQLSSRRESDAAALLGASAVHGSAGAAQIVLTSYSLLLRDADALAKVSWDGVILDEAQNIKNASAKQAQAARRMRGRYRLTLTGTPVENALSDLWSIFAFAAPGYLGSADTFRARLATPIERWGDEDARRTLRQLIGPLVLRRTKAEPGVADELPPRIETLQRCLLTREQAALYEAVARQLLARVEESTGLRRRAAVLLALLRLKQVCNHPAHFSGDGSALDGRSGKLLRLQELLDEVVAEGERALVFTQFAVWARLLAEHLAARYGARAPVLRLDGTTPAMQRAELVARFQEGVGPAVFVLSVKAGGAGLNLTAARHVFHYDRWWNPAVERQATDRAHRIGQTGTVQVHKLVCVGTLEERIDRLIREKEALAEGVLGQGSGEAWLTELDDTALREVLTLRRAALG